tara:strand:- start:458 stop:1369 length:912 start_codon:yes stop_codon:yes gene_type:complete
MIKYVNHNYIDRRKYDHCILMDPSKLIYGLSWYLDSICSSWDALVLNDYDAVWPLPVNTKFGIKYFYRPFGAQQLGIFSKVKLSQNQNNEFLKTLIKNASFAEVFGNEGQSFQSPEVQISSQVNYILKINRSYQNIYESYSKGIKRKLKKAQKEKFKCFENESPKALIDLFKQNKGKNLKLDPAFYRNIEKIMFAAIHKKTGEIWSIYGEGNTICAGIFVLHFRSRICLLFSASNQEAQNKGGLAFLINEYIIQQSAKKEIFDFEGGSDAGMAQFYSGFGAEERIYKKLKYNGLPFWLKWIKK